MKRLATGALVMGMTAALSLSTGASWAAEPADPPPDEQQG